MIVKCHSVEHICTEKQYGEPYALKHSHVLLKYCKSTHKIFIYMFYLSFWSVLVFKLIVNMVLQ